MFVKLLKAAGAGALLASLLVTPTWAQKTKLTVYTALENDQLAPSRPKSRRRYPASISNGCAIQPASLPPLSGREG